ncbi:tripartite tricarboxylate transporter substrate binding protein [Nocardioides sp. dk4132]|uniref:Bug family tripartite tricarboxylate transporter substrate binding protein n=1 Tax=unclassified Nocardioides TaxID=2615069 RepID=UPI001297B534|nr:MULTISPECIES: tripartite tricarboxylate transporter substrate-binding protein [unclassified Nocardioides]MQW76070.1 tripartite tricarboxylate transporter substrate binding protein [Nocardioides sp. dk4132]QGA08918.1 tripartite tricarboxylate transporter substrate binding protein [Nocardioides sp. dk884]
MKRFVPYVLAGVLAIVLVVVTQTGGGAPSAAEELLGDQQLKVMAPADPGGGWDGTARQMQSALQDLTGRSEVYNVGGAGGTIGLSQMAQRDGQVNQLMVMGLVMVGAIAANQPEVDLTDVTPIAALTTEPLAIVVPEDSEIEDVEGLVAAMERNIGAVSWAGGSAGGAEQILAGLVAQAAGLDASQVNYIAHSGGGEAVSTLLSGSATVGLSGVSELLPQIEAGALRAIAVSGSEPSASLPDVPTLLDAGLDVELTNWRGVVAPAGLTDEQREGLEELMAQMVETEAWQEALEREGWTDAFVAGEEFRSFVREETIRVEKVVAELGIGSVS